MTNIFDHCINGNLTEVHRLIQQGIDINQTNNYVFTPLHYASKYGHLDIVQELIENGSHVNKKTIVGFTPLHFAADNSHFKNSPIIN